MKSLRGILLPFPTPFDEQERIDVFALRSNLSRWSETGINGYVALGSTGERVHLEERECLEVVEAARRVVPPEMAFIVGAGQESVRATISEVRRVAEAGADAALLITPHFYRGAMTQSALSRYYLMVADSAPLPLVLYSMPELTGIALAPETVAQLSQHENIVGIKDSSGDIINFAETIRRVPEDFAVLTGSGPLLYAALCAGAWGGILAVGCAAPLIAVRIYEAVKAGEHERAKWLQQRLAPLALAVTKRYGIGGLKAALDRIGYTGGRVRAPLQEPAEDARREIARTLEACGSVEELTGSVEEFRQAGAAE
ncbi:MAG TPA: dihydrodipicolinate synthase family protein [Pyrinomonadaceae bacterium]